MDKTYSVFTTALNSLQSDPEPNLAISDEVTIEYSGTVADVQIIMDENSVVTTSFGHGVYIRTYPGGHAVIHAPGKLLLKGDEYIDLNPAMPNADSTIDELIEGEIIDGEIRIHAARQPTEEVRHCTKCKGNCGSKTRKREDNVTD